MKVTCPGCGNGGAISRKVSRYHYVESGLDNVWLLNGVTETRCSSCGRSFNRILNEPQLLQVIALSLLMKAGTTTGPELRFIRVTCEMTQEELAKTLRVRRATVAEREAKEETKISMAEEIGLRILLLDAFERFVTTEGNGSLTASHLRQLDLFVKSVGELSRTVGRERPARVTVRHAQQQELWQLPLAA